MTEATHGLAPHNIHELAPHKLPFFIPGADGSDVLLTATTIILVLAVLFLGVGYFWLHSLPERIAHKAHKTQMQIVAVLCLVALFTENQAFWIAALFLAIIDIPDFMGPIRRMTGALEQIAKPSTASASAPAPKPAPAAAEQDH